MNKKTDGYWRLEADDGTSTTVRYIKTLVKWVRAKGDQQVSIQWFTNDGNFIRMSYTVPNLTDDEICTRAIATRQSKEL